jgi:hypothetical protein
MLGKVVNSKHHKLRSGKFSLYRYRKVESLCSYKTGTTSYFHHLIDEQKEETLKYPQVKKKLTHFVISDQKNLKRLLILNNVFGK